MGRIQALPVVRRAVLLLAIGVSVIVLVLRLGPNGQQPIAAADRVGLANCATLSAPPLSSPSELNSYLDLDRGTISIEISGSSDWAATVSYSDPTCLAHSVLGPIIAEHLEDARVVQLTECADLAGRVASGRVVLRGQEMNMDKVRAYMDRWCDQPV
jgi:hypothetical protein